MARVRLQQVEWFQYKDGLTNKQTQKWNFNEKSYKSVFDQANLCINIHGDSQNGIIICPSSGSLAFGGKISILVKNRILIRNNIGERLTSQVYVTLCDYSKNCNIIHPLTSK